MKPDGLIAAKLAQITEEVDRQDVNIKIIESLGGKPDTRSIDFQRGRRDLLQWAQTAPEPAIEARIRQLETELGPAVSLKYGSLAGVPEPAATLICHVELLEFALGVHPALAGRIG